MNFVVCKMFTEDQRGVMGAVFDGVQLDTLMLATSKVLKIW